MESNHPYAKLNTNRDPKQIISDTIQIKWGDMKNYVVHSKIGRGKYSHVFDGTDKKTGKRVAVKVLVPIRKDKIKREYHILNSLNHPNVGRLLQIVQCPYLKVTSLILEYCPHVDFRELYSNFSLKDIKFYMKQLFKGLDYLHSKGIMHRDIKPFNILINPETKSLKIIDFGLSDYYIPGKENSQHVASLYYKAPELLFSNPNYDYRVDCWSAGMILAGLIFKKTPFIQGNDNIDQVLKITKLLGTVEVVQYIKKNKLAERRGHARQNICFDLIVAHQNGDMAVDQASTLEQYVNQHNKQNCTKEALSLLKKLLQLDFNKRITAKQALGHPFFQGI